MEKAQKWLDKQASVEFRLLVRKYGGSRNTWALWANKDMGETCVISRLPLATGAVHGRGEKGGSATQNTSLAHPESTEAWPQRRDPWQKQVGGELIFRHTGFRTPRQQPSKAIQEPFLIRSTGNASVHPPPLGSDKQCPTSRSAGPMSASLRAEWGPNNLPNDLCGRAQLGPEAPSCPPSTDLVLGTRTPRPQHRRAAAGAQPHIGTSLQPEGKGAKGQSPRLSTAQVPPSSGQGVLTLKLPFPGEPSSLLLVAILRKMITRILFSTKIRILSAAEVGEWHCQLPPVSLKHL